MDSIKTVLITGGGAPGIVGTIWALKNNPENAMFKIVTTDIRDNVVGKYISDVFYRIPPPESPEYIERLVEICHKEKVSVVLPQTTREILVLSKNKERLKKKGIYVCVSNYESIKEANDKYLLLKKAVEIGIPYPEFYLTNSKDSLVKAVYKIGYPQKKVVVKPRTSNGMRGVRVITEDVWDASRFLTEKPSNTDINLDTLIKILSKGGPWPELIVSEYLEGVEYSVDVFRNNKGTVAIPRLRQSIRSGITFDAKIDMRKDLIDYSQQLSKALNLNYAFGFQFKLDKKGTPKLLECNPRVQGTMVAATFAGFNIIYASVQEALGSKIRFKSIKLIDNVEFKRYWGGIGIVNGKFNGKI